jgi:hypothetical protein
MLDANKESLRNLADNLKELGLKLGDIPMVFQWNKRDLRNVISVEELEAAFNPRATPSFQSVASDGTGVFETLRGITKLALSHIKTTVLGEGQVPPSLVSVPPPPQPPPAPPAAVESARSAGEALTLSDLPSVSDLLDMEGSHSAGAQTGAAPLPDEDEDSTFFIEAPLLPEPPDGSASGFRLVGEKDRVPVAPPALPEESDELSFLLNSALGPGVPSGGPSVQAEPEPEPTVSEAPVPTQVIPVQSPQVPRTVQKADPLTALAALEAETRRPAPKPKPVDSKNTIDSLMGELTQAGRSGAPSVLRLELPADAEGEIEVVVQVRRQGQVVVEGQIHRSTPAKGITTKLSVELKRS